MKASAFIAASAAVILFLGFSHLLYTFRGPMLHPRDPDLTARMMTVSPVISRQTPMWRVWVGINATHSFGLTEDTARQPFVSNNTPEAEWWRS